MTYQKLNETEARIASSNACPHCNGVLKFRGSGGLTDYIVCVGEGVSQFNHSPFGWFQVSDNRCTDANGFAAQRRV